MNKLKVAVVTPAGQVARLEADMITAPSVLGEIGVLADHRALLADLKEGPVILRNGSATEVYAVSDGFIEVDHNAVTVLAETAEHSSAIDVARSQAALKSAEAKLSGLDAADPEYAEQQARIRRARVRLAVAGR